MTNPKYSTTSTGCSLPRLFRQVSRYHLITFLLLLFTNKTVAQGTWTPVTNQSVNYDEGVMLLLTDGSVLVKTYGGTGIGYSWDKLTPDIHGSYVNGSWTTVSSMNDSRLYFSTQVLKNGTVYAAGGEYGTGKSKAEIYDPINDVWSPTYPATDPTDTFYDANSKLLPDGKVLQAVVLTGHLLSKRTYIFDPATASFSLGAPTIGYDDEATWLKLPDSSILFPNIYSLNSERYIPLAGTWVSDSALPVNLYDSFGSEAGPATMLPDGRAFFLGSRSTSAYYTPSGNTSPGSWAAGPVIPDSLGAPDAPAAMMVNGKMLCAFSHTPTYDSVFHSRMWFYEFNYLTNSFTRIHSPEGGDSIDAPCYNASMLCLPDGSVLFARQGRRRYFVYTPDGAPLAAGKPTIDSILFNDCDTFIATGKLFNGISAGASYGDDWQMDSNYPIIRISRNDTVYYAATYNWNSTGIMRGSNEDTTQFVLPAGIPHGTYQLQVVANGNASAPVSFSFCDALGVTSVKPVTKQFNAFPNPAHDQVTLEYNAPVSGPCVVRFTDVFGRQVMMQNFQAVAGGNAFQVPVAHLAAGMYSVSLKDNHATFNTRVLIK